MKTIAQHKNYVLQIDTANNRLNMELKAFWTTTDYSVFVVDLRKAIAELQTGFSVLCKAQTLKNISNSMMLQKNVVYNTLAARGMGTLAELEPKCLSAKLLSEYRDKHQLRRVRYFTSEQLAITYIMASEQENCIRKKTTPNRASVSEYSFGQASTTLL